MPFDAIAMASVADELKRVLDAGRVQKIIQPSPFGAALAIYAGRHQHWLIASADAEGARVNLATDKLAKAFAEPSPFIMLLRKYLDGSRLIEVRHLPFERVLILSFSSSSHSQDHDLVVEVMGKHSNIMLVYEGVILGAVKVIRRDQSRVRPIVPGLPYTSPPTQAPSALFDPADHRIDPSTERAYFSQVLRRLPPNSPVGSVLQGILRGASPFLVNEICCRAEAESSIELADLDLEKVVDAAADMYGLYSSHQWTPSLFQSKRGKLDFAPYIPRQVGEVEQLESMSDAVERTLSSGESSDSLRTTRQVVLRQLEAAHKSNERRIASLKEGLGASTSSETVMQQGQLLLAYQHAVPPQATSLDLPDYGIQIPLNPRLSPSENAERIFKRYRKLRDAGRRLPELIAEAELERTRLDDAKVFADLAESAEALRALRSDLDEERPKKQKQKGHAKAPAKAGPPRYRLDGYTAMLGRNARENEEVTFKHAGREDLWLHVRGRTGTHLVLQGNPPEEVIRSAAALAAYHSEGRTDTGVDVDVTEVRNVRKIAGGAPGRVTYRNSQTFRVAPAVGEWKLIGKREK